MGVQTIRTIQMYLTTTPNKLLFSSSCYKLSLKCKVHVILYKQDITKNVKETRQNHIGDLP